MSETIGIYNDDDIYLGYATIDAAGLDGLGGPFDDLILAWCHRCHELVAETSNLDYAQSRLVAHHQAEHR